MNTKEKYNVDAAWENIHSRFEKDGLLTSGNKIRNVDFYMITKIAAIFIIALFVGYQAYNSFSNGGQTGMQLAETYTGGKIKIIELPDGSIVHINQKSKLHYPENFSANERIVELEGEAFFDIKKNPQKPFIIKAGNKKIKVLGTSFNVNTNFEGEKVEVYVETGKVKFYEPGNKQKELILEPGSIGTLDKIAEKKVIDDLNYMSWKTKYFDFTRGEKLDKVIATINKAYGVNIVLENIELAKRKHHTTYNNTSLDTILKLLCTSQKLKSKKQGDLIILKVQ